MSRVYSQANHRHPSKHGTQFIARLLHAQGLSVLAAFNASAGDDHRIEEAVDLWDEACATTKAAELELGAASDSSESAEAGDAASDDGAAISLSRASVLCSAAQGELLLGRGTAKASEILAEALRIREKFLPAGHPATVSLFPYRTPPSY